MPMIDTKEPKTLIELEMIALLCRAVEQFMRERDGVYFSGFITLNADILEFLVGQGIMDAVGDRCDRNFSARFKRDKK